MAKIWNRVVMLIVLEFLEIDNCMRMQVVCKDWYNDKMPMALASVDTMKLRDYKGRVKRLLTSIPAWVSPPSGKCIRNW